MLKTFAGIVIILLTVGVYGSTDYQPTTFIKDTKLIGSLHQNNEVEMFLGIPFAVPPINDLRWEKPIAWTPENKKEITANKFRAACIQNQRIVNWYKRLILDFGSDPRTFDIPEFSEDCLYLNLWRPRELKNNLPVIVYIHGGSNKAGWAYEPNYHGHNIANKGFILISIPYRLGVFGFFSHPDIESPNLALYDQILALEWIQKYVSLFGGDPSNVTLVGESAGAGGISHLIASPLSKNLFHKAVHQSGGSSFTYPTSVSDVRKLANSFANSFEDPSLKNLKNISAEEILEVSEEVYAGHYFNYVDDGISMIGNLSDTFKSQNVENVDLLIGSNNDEWSLYFDGNVNIGLWLDEETTPEKKIKLLQLLENIKDPIRKMDLLITSKNFDKSDTIPLRSSPDQPAANAASSPVIPLISVPDIAKSTMYCGIPAAIRYLEASSMVLAFNISSLCSVVIPILFCPNVALSLTCIINCSIRLKNSSTVI